jgi:lipopolysaccharide/colanic/teichoic acid biosynthesis glycosyltransferase
MAKIIFDIVLAYLGIFFLFPLWIIFAFAIWFEDGLPIFYIQERVGKQARIFGAIKFRTIYYGKGGSLIAKILRRTALDESPQLINIIRREMSFVGPRPLIPQEINSGENQHLRSSITPGLTGIAQVVAEKDAPVTEKLKYDLWYIEHQSIWLDAQLILKSFWMSLNRKWDIIRGTK